MTAQFAATHLYKIAHFAQISGAFARDRPCRDGQLDLFTCLFMIFYFFLGNWYPRSCGHLHSDRSNLGLMPEPRLYNIDHISPRSVFGFVGRRMLERAAAGRSCVRGGENAALVPLLNPKFANALAAI